MGVIKNGSRGKEVEELQLGLQKLGYDIKADGIFGNGTEKIVKEVQSLFNYTVDGMVGDGTKGLIEAQAGHGWSIKDPDAKAKAQAANPVSKTAKAAPNYDPNKK